MGKGASDGITDAHRESPRAPAEKRVRANFDDPEHVRYLLETYAAYVEAIDADDTDGVRSAIRAERPFNFCSDKFVGFRSNHDCFPYIVNEFAYQTGDFTHFVREHLDRVTEPAAKRQKQ